MKMEDPVQDKIPEPEKFEPRFYELDEYLKLPRRPSKWIIEGLVPVGYTNIYANPKIGKSFLALGICEAVVCDEEMYFQFPIHTHGPVAYLQIDTPREEWASRYEEIERIKRLKNRKFPFYTADMWNVPAYPFNILQGKAEASIKDNEGKPVPDGEWLKRELQRIKPILLVIDTLRDMHEGDEDKSGDMRRVLGHLAGIVGPDCSIILVSHSRKDSVFTTNSEDDIMQGGRGSNAVAGKMDMVIRMTKQEVHTKGRAKGYKKYAYHQVPEHEPDEGRIVFDQEKEEQKNDIYATINMLSDNNPGITQHALAMKLAALLKCSDRTATRRIKEWRNQQEARVKALERLADNPQGQELILPNGNKIDLTTGEEYNPNSLWHQPIQWD